MTTNMFKTNAYKRENSAKIHARAVLRHVEQIAAERSEKQGNKLRKNHHVPVVLILKTLRNTHEKNRARC